MRRQTCLSLLLLLLLGLVQAQEDSEEEAVETSPIDDITPEQCDKKVSSRILTKSS